MVRRLRNQEQEAVSLSVVQASDFARYPVMLMSLWVPVAIDFTLCVAFVIFARWNARRR